MDLVFGVLKIRYAKNLILGNKAQIVKQLEQQIIIKIINLDLFGGMLQKPLLPEEYQL